jgi:Ca2+-binding EF-hand superfamily protein
VLRKTFKQMDKDGSGTLSRKEIIDAAKTQAGLDVEAENIADLLLVLSKDVK